MSVDFPSNPIIGATYHYNNILWSYNGYAWDRFDTDIGRTGHTDIGVMYLKGNTAQTTIGSINGRAIVNGTIQTGDLYNFSKDNSNNALKYFGFGGKFHIIANFNFYSGSQNVCGFYIGKNSIAGSSLDPNADRISESEIYANSSSSSAQPVSSTIQTILDLKYNDRIFFIVQNKDATNSIQIEFLKFVAVQID